VWIFLRVIIARWIKQFRRQLQHIKNLIAIMLPSESRTLCYAKIASATGSDPLHSLRIVSRSPSNSLISPRCLVAASIFYGCLFLLQFGLSLAFDVLFVFEEFLRESRIVTDSSWPNMVSLVVASEFRSDWIIPHCLSEFLSTCGKAGFIVRWMRNILMMSLFGNSC